MLNYEGTASSVRFEYWFVYQHQCYPLIISTKKSLFAPVIGLIEFYKVTMTVTF